MIESSDMRSFLNIMYQDLKTMRNYNFSGLGKNDIVNLGSNRVPRIMEKKEPLDGVRSVRMYANRPGIADVVLNKLPILYRENAQTLVDKGYSAKILVDGFIEKSLNHDDSVSFMNALVIINNTGHRLLPDNLRISTTNQGFELELNEDHSTDGKEKIFSYEGKRWEEVVPIFKLQGIIDSNPELKGKVELRHRHHADIDDSELFYVRAESELDVLNAYRLILQANLDAAMISNLSISEYAAIFSSDKFHNPWYAARIDTRYKRRSPRSEPLPWNTKDVVFKTPGLKDIAGIKLRKGRIQVTINHKDKPVLVSGPNKKIPEVIEEISSLPELPHSFY